MRQHFGHHNLGNGTPAIKCVETRDAVKHSSVHKTVPYGRELSHPNVSSDVEKPCSDRTGSGNAAGSCGRFSFRTVVTAALGR